MEEPAPHVSANKYLHFSTGKYFFHDYPNMPLSISRVPGAWVTDSYISALANDVMRSLC